MSSNKLAEYVREMEISFTPYPGLSHAEAEQMVAECLERTSQLAILTFRNESSLLFTKLVAARVHRLPKLKEFTFDGTFDGSQMDNNEEVHESDGFDPDGWLPLPKSIQKLEFRLPSASILEVLPQLFTNLSEPGVGNGFQESGQSDMAGNLLTQPGGLRSLSLKLDFRQTRHISLVQKVYAKLSFPPISTLTSVILDNSRALESEDLHRLLSAMLLLEHLELNLVNVSGDLFGGLKPFTKLQTFACTFCNGSSWDNFKNCCDRFCQSFIKSIRHSPHFHSLSLKHTWCGLVPSDVIGSLVHGLVIATSLDGTPDHSRLRKLDIDQMGNLPIEALEELCQAAPNILVLRVDVNDDKCRILHAFRSLTGPHLIKVNGSTLLSTCEPKGENLDTLDFPLGFRPYTEDDFESEIEEMSASEMDQLLRDIYHIH